MNETLVLVVSPAPELASRVNTAVRGAGLVVQVEWASDSKDAAKQADRKSYDLMFCEVPAVEPAAIVALARRQTPAVPVVALAESADDEQLGKALSAGARDYVVADRTQHVAAVARRELEALAAMRAVEAARGHVDTAREQRDALFLSSGDALARAEDGIVVLANPAWAELFGAERAEPGTPVMDVFDAAAHPALRAALRKAEAATLALNARGDGGVQVPVTVGLRPLDGDLLEIAIRSGAGQRALAEELDRARRQDRDTGLLNRAAFIDALTANPDRTVVLARIDDFARLVEQMGVFGSDAVAVQFAAAVRERLAPDQVAGRLDGTLFGVLLAAPESAAVAWASGFRDAVAAKVFEHDGKSTAVATSIGISGSTEKDVGKRLDQALAALRTARQGGSDGVKVHTEDKPVAAAVGGVSDADWATRIKRALMQGHFRLAFQPVASLRGEKTEINDTLLRLLDPEHGEILPGEFLPAAERVGLMPAIDRWVIGHAVRTLREPSHRTRGTTVFVRVSDASLTDATLGKWLAAQLGEAPLEQGRLVFEISETQSERLLKESRASAELFRTHGCGVLLSRFGGRASSARMLEHLKVDYTKLDTALLKGLARDKDRQASVKALIEQLREHQALSIAPGVEDANTMAVLWQLGVDFVQGNYLQEPEVVIAG